MQSSTLSQLIFQQDKRMSTHCSDPVACPDGNCIGCKDGKVDCQDIRCSPFCPGDTCTIPSDHDFASTVAIIIILICLFAILITVWFAYGPQLLYRPKHNERVRYSIDVL